jgi:lipoate-protein ligase A
VPWRLLLTPALDGPENMALDEALMARARRTSETVLRVYSWSSPTLSLGRNQRARDLYDERTMRGVGVGIVRRPTGGRALLHHREVTYSVTAPVTASESIAVVYGRINALLLTALAALGVQARAATPAGRSLPPGATPCFAEPSTGELVFGERKLVGSAQWRDDGAVLQHGSILVDDDQALIPSLMMVPVLAPPRPATLRTALGRAPSPCEIAEALWEAVRSLEDRGANVLELDDETRRHAGVLTERYRDPVWTWRR